MIQDDGSKMEEITLLLILITAKVLVGIRILSDKFLLTFYGYTFKFDGNINKTKFLDL